MAWFLSPALVRLRAEINTLWPHRDRASDGSIGDASHSARRSDHNPDYQAGGIVRAIDVDEDGIPAWDVVARVIADPRTAYVIYEGRIWENPAAFPGRGYWRTYSGPNPHSQHFHVSVRRGTRWDSNDSPWGLLAGGVGNVSNPIRGAGGSIPVPDLDPITPITPTWEDDMALSPEGQQQIRDTVSAVVRAELAPVLGAIKQAEATIVRCSTGDYAGRIVIARGSGVKVLTAAEWETLRNLGYTLDFELSRGPFDAWVSAHGGYTS